MVKKLEVILKILMIQDIRNMEIKCSEMINNQIF